MKDATHKPRLTEVLETGFPSMFSTNSLTWLASLCEFYLTGWAMFSFFLFLYKRVDEEEAEQVDEGKAARGILAWSQKLYCWYGKRRKRKPADALFLLSALGLFRVRVSGKQMAWWRPIYRTMQHSLALSISPLLSSISLPLLSPQLYSFFIRFKMTGHQLSTANSYSYSNDWGISWSTPASFVGQSQNLRITNDSLCTCSRLPFWFLCA